MGKFTQHVYVHSLDRPRTSAYRRGGHALRNVRVHCACFAALAQASRFRYGCAMAVYSHNSSAWVPPVCTNQQQQAADEPQKSHWGVTKDFSNSGGNAQTLSP